MKNKIFKWIGVILLIYFLIASIGIVGSGFKLATGEFAKELLVFASNPFAGLLVGILVTSLVQSSSTVTSIIVGLVSGGLPLSTAIPLVFGANIGTSITSTIVSTNYASDKKEFKRAFAAATIHDFFNLLAVLIIFPLEMYTHFLEKVSGTIANNIYGTFSFDIKSFNFVKFLTKPFIGIFKSLVENIPHPLNGLTMIILGAILVFVAILYLGKLLKSLMVGRVRDYFVKVVGSNPIISIFSGIVSTVLVQSSSTTTSLIVPFASQNIIKLKDVYTFVLGANIGTCITALIASTGVIDNSITSLQIALIHLLFNITGIIIVYGIPTLRVIPLILSQGLAEAAGKKKYLAWSYLVLVFFLLPGVLLVFTS